MWAYFSEPIALRITLSLSLSLYLFIYSSHAVTADLEVSDMAKAAEFFCSDGVIVTGSETGSPAPLQDVRAVREVTKLPLIVGSGVTEENLGEYCGCVDAVIVGSHFKVKGLWNENVDEDRVAGFMRAHGMGNM